MITPRSTLLAAAMLTACVDPAAASTIVLDLGGSSSYDGWTNLTVGGGYTGVIFPGTAAWRTAGTGNWSSYTHNPGTGEVTVGAIGSNTAGSGDALLYKVSNGNGGGPYPASQSIYFGGASGEINNNGGTLGVVDTSPLNNLKTVAFQVEIGAAWGYDFWNAALPTLTYTTSSGSHTIEATYSTLLSQQYSGEALMPTGYEDVNINTWGMQYDLSAIEGILSIELNFTGVQHAQLYALQLDQSDAVYDSILFPQAIQWSAGGENSQWSTSSNWDGEVVPSSDVDVTFGTGSEVVLDSDRTVKTLTLSSGSGFMLGSSGDSILTIGAGGIVADSGETSASYVIGGPMVLSTFNSITVGDNDELTLAGNVNAPGFYKKGEGTLRLEGDNTFTGNSFNRLIIVGGENYISGTNTYTGSGDLELNVKDGVVTLHGGDDRLSSNFNLNLVSTAVVNGSTPVSEATGHLILGDAASRSNQTFAGIQSAKTNLFNEATSSSSTGATSNSSITAGHASISTLTVHTSGTHEYWGQLGGAGENQNHLALVKKGSGTQALGGTSTYVGDTIIEGGMLRIDSATALSANSNIQLNGGVLGLGANSYSANLGTGAGEVQFTGDGGFAAHAAARTVTLNEGAGLIWGSTSGFLGDGHKLILSHSSANQTVDFTNSIDLGSQARTVRVDNGSGAIDARLSGVLSGSGELSKTGAGTLELTSANTYTGGTVVREGNLTLSGAGGSIQGDVWVGGGATLQLTNTATANHTNRLENTAKVTMKGGTLNFSNPTAGTTPSYSETFGELVLSGGANVISTSRAAAGNTATLTASTLTREAGATVNFSGASVGADTRNRVLFTSAPALQNGIIGGWATVGTTYEFATYGANGVTAYTGYNTNLAQGSWGSTHNVKLNTAAGMTTNLSADRVIHSLIMNGATSGTTGNQLNLGGNELRIGSGGLVGTAGAATRQNVISNGTLTAGSSVNTAAELIVATSGVQTFIQADIVDNGTGAVSLVKSGTGSLYLNGTNTYTGSTTVNQGTLVLQSEGSISQSSVIQVNPSTTLNVSAVSEFTIGSSQTLQGTGNVIGNIFMAGTVSPGLSTGTLTVGTTTLYSGANYFLEFADASGEAGTGWDLLNVTGVLSFGATEEDPFFLTLAKAGELLGFDPLQDYDFVIATAAGGISNFSESIFSIDATGIPESAAGLWSVSQSGNDLLLSYNAIPEPAPALLAALGFGVFFIRRRRFSSH